MPKATYFIGALQCRQTKIAVCRRQDHVSLSNLIVIETQRMVYKLLIARRLLLHG
jgi:hypothetical protein